MTTPRGIRNNNPLNIRKGNTWKGEIPNQTDPAFEQFESMEMGLRAAFVLLRNYITGRTAGGKRYDTVDAIIRKWAPPSENATQKYIDYVAKEMGIHPRSRIYFWHTETMVQMVKAMAFVECGVQLDENIIRSAYYLV